MMISSVPLHLAEDYEDDGLFDQFGVSARDRAIRRRSSRGSRQQLTLCGPWRLTRVACDSCRKIKSRCEPPSAPGEPCKSCALLGLGMRFCA